VFFVSAKLIKRKKSGKIITNAVEHLAIISDIKYQGIKNKHIGVKVLT
jgi:cysteine sulfinate desulfinase/cysteine desulfurase-like protein